MIKRMDKFFPKIHLINFSDFIDFIDFLMFRLYIFTIITRKCDFNFDFAMTTKVHILFKVNIN